MSKTFDGTFVMATTSPGIRRRKLWLEMALDMLLLRTGQSISAGAPHLSFP